MKPTPLHASSTFAPLGVLSDGTPIGLDLSRPTHIAIQGMTRSGKTASTYHFLGTLAESFPDQVTVHMVDPTTVLGRPLVGHACGGKTCLGTTNPTNAVVVVEHVLDLMRSRIDDLWTARTDKITAYHPDYRLQLLVVEELPGVVEWLADDDAACGRKPAQRLAPRFIAGLRQIIAQGLKVGIVVMLLAQRFDAAVISGPARSNIGLRISLRVDDPDAVRMLFPGVLTETIEALATAPPGRGLVSTAEHRAVKVRLFHTDYAEYLARLEQVTPSPAALSP